ncbi:MAG: Yip1 domain [Erythrobacteraceae bacterium HL-111]|nr:MAG: Yip1 domain [Erythrobacteraceae bacterium HL-111]
MTFLPAKGESRLNRRSARAVARAAFAMRCDSPHWGAMADKSPLDNPENAAHAWARYRQIMKLLLVVTIATVTVALALLYAFNGMVSVHYFIAVALGIAFTMLLSGGLMGLAFLSNGTGHDEAVDNRLPQADELFGRRDRD